MKKNKLTKAERLAAYKAEKAAEKAKIERWEQLAKYLSTNCMLVITNIEEHFYHDAMLLEKKGVKVSLDEIGRNLRMLHGDGKYFVCHPGRFEFSPSRFFEYAKETNPHLLFSLPSAIRDLCVENLIEFKCIEENNHGSLGTSAYFEILKS